jgi:hypothetical protein
MDKKMVIAYKNVEKGINWQTIFNRIRRDNWRSMKLVKCQKHLSDEPSREFRYSTALSQFTKNVFLSISMLGVFLQKVEDK